MRRKVFSMLALSFVALMGLGCSSKSTAPKMTITMDMTTPGSMTEMKLPDPPGQPPPKRPQ